MSQEVTTLDANIISSLVINGDLSKLDAGQKVRYYRMFCERLGLDPISQPFKLLKLQGKETLYCDRGGSQQLSRVHGVSHEIKSRETINGIFIVTAVARTKERQTESVGAVPISNLQGDALANAMMKAETKAKRRATLDLLGLGMLDETEVETIPDNITELPIKEDLTPEHASFANVVKALQGGYSWADVERKYNISEDVKELINNSINQPA
jgi:hypothetical protein